MEENGIKPEIIGGTSCGSMVAVMYALGYSPYHIYILFTKYAKTIAKTNTVPIINGIKNYLFKKDILDGINNGTNIEKVFNIISNRRYIDNINKIKMPIAIPSVDLLTGKECIFTNCLVNKEKYNFKEYLSDISVGKAIRASSSFPGYFSPLKYKQYAFMDGGALNNVPVDEVKRMGADIILSVKFHSDSVEKNSNIMDIVMKSIDIMGTKISEDNLKLSDYILDVYTDKVGLLDIKKLDKCYEYGYNCVKDNINIIKKKLKI